jgi:hypothetical protein
VIRHPRGIRWVSLPSWPRACTEREQEPLGLPKFFDASLPACHGLRTPADLHRLAIPVVRVLPSGAFKPSASAKPFRSCTSPRSRTQVELCEFCVRRGDFSRLGVLGGQECLCEDRNVAAIMLTASCNISSDHPLLTLFAAIPLLPPLHVDWDTALLAGKCPMFA